VTLDLPASETGRVVGGRYFPDPVKIARVCALSAWRGGGGRCRWCDAVLEGKRTSWCSDDHYRRFAEQHDWKVVARAAIARDGATCRRCGAKGKDDLLAGMLRAESRVRRRRLDEYELAAFDRFGALLDRLNAERARVRLEVNHVDPLRGGRVWVDCAHHLDGVETLCHSCHVEETRLQTISTRAVGPPMTVACRENRHDRCWANADRVDRIACLCSHHPHTAEALYFVGGTLDLGY
jgi:hypothetical protein